MITLQQQEKILELCRAILPKVSWAPGESWLEEGETETARHPFISRSVCDCGDAETPEPPALTLFLKCDILGSGDLVREMEDKVGYYLETEGVVGAGCGVCEGKVAVDVRLFSKYKHRVLPLMEDEYSTGSGFVFHSLSVPQRGCLIH